MHKKQVVEVENQEEQNREVKMRIMDQETNQIVIKMFGMKENVLIHQIHVLN